jgi:hypothetical protein
VKAYFDVLSDPDTGSHDLYKAYQRLSPKEWLLVCLCLGGIGDNQFGFRAEVGRA